MKSPATASRKVRALAAALALSLVAAGCGGIGPKQQPAGEPPVPARVSVSGLLDIADPSQLSMAQLGEGLAQYVNESDEPVSARLETLWNHWKLKPVGNSVLQIEEDLDSDLTTEVITVYRNPKSANGMGTLFVIYMKDGKYLVDQAPGETLGAALHAVDDVNADGRREIVWSSTSVGANTATSQVFVTAWSPGSLVNLPGDMSMTNVKVEANHMGLFLKGGLLGGWGAGRVQRERIDRYIWTNGSMKRVESAFTPSQYAYHRLQDGILAEMFDFRRQAQVAYEEAAESGRPPLQPEDTVPPDQMERFANAVRNFAIFRNAVGMMTGKTDPELIRHIASGGSGEFSGLPKSALGATDRAVACDAAIHWAETNPEFLKLLNSPRGYANPQWKPADLCGGLPNVK